MPPVCTLQNKTGQRTKSIEVVHVTPSLSYKGGGVSLAFWKLASHQAELGLTVSLMGLKDRYTSDDTPVYNNIRCYTGTVTGPRFLSYSSDLRRNLYSQHNADLIHVHGLWMYPGVAARITAAKARIPLIISPHGMLDSWALKNSIWKKKIAGWLYENRNLRSAACIHALCEPEYQSIRAYGLKNPVAIISNGVDLPNLTDKKVIPPWEPRVDADKNVMLFLGRIHPKKGLANLVKAWSKVKPKDWILAIAGWDQGGHENQLKELVSEHGLTEDIIFLGPVFNDLKQACLQNASAFILPSFSEGLPMSVLEAWSYGLPVLMTKFCNIPEGFEANAAIEIQPESDSIAEGMKEFIALSSDEQGQIGRNGLELIKDKFTWPKIAAQMVDVYKWILEQGDKPDYVRLD